ncbi:GPI-anchored protein LORELEI [Zostera marina]|uniref:GPI-anchored protein LORELEI n=1 Tax=Zostera marina TaxID=29655 RepID=A0A0K9P969_ZOSMR|nr:GPI-anchored protein LORELEI [Zostera marina]
MGEVDVPVSFFRHCILFFLVASAVLPGSATVINDDAFASGGSVRRNLLQTKKSCPLNFEFMNYTVITSKCKGPLYPPKLCCEGFKEFACPVAEEINDGTNDCATTMFSYINLYGKYPPGLFASECREGKEGLECPLDSTSSSDARRRLLSPSVAVFVAGLFLIFS